MINTSETACEIAPERQDLLIRVALDCDRIRNPERNGHRSGDKSFNCQLMPDDKIRNCVLCDQPRNDPLGQAIQHGGVENAPGRCQIFEACTPIKGRDSGIQCW